MKAVKKTPSYNLAWALIGIATTGVSLSMLLARDARWMQWHLSRLGEGESLSSAVFNFTLIFAAMVLVLLAVRVTDELTRTHLNQRASLLRTLLFITAMCWVGVGVFPFDRFPVIHNVFGYGQFFIICSIMLGIRQFSSAFSDRTHTIGYGAVLITGVMMAFFHLTHFTTLLVVELIGQLFVYAWFLSMTHDLRRTIDQG